MFNGGWDYWVAFMQTTQLERHARTNRRQLNLTHVHTQSTISGEPVIYAMLCDDRVA